jgi:pepF/M3 family oligoendopeptidase
VAGTATTDQALPHWDLTPIFPSLDSTEFVDEFDAVAMETQALTALFDARGISRDAELAEAPDVFDEVTARLNDVLERLSVVYAYVVAHVRTDSRDEAAQARMSELRLRQVELSKLYTRFVAWVGSLDTDALLERSDTAREHEFMVRRAAEAAQHQMTPAEEELAAELGPSGASAWAKLHGDVTSQLAVEVEIDGENRQLPMSEVRNLAHDSDRDVRRRAYEAELRAWEASSVPLAAALNSVKGEANVLAARRGWGSPLESVLFESQIDRATLDAMLAAVREALPDLRRYLDAKARALGVPKLAWYDLFAPVAIGGQTEGRDWSFESGHAFILEHFGSYSEPLRDLAERAFDERWIDAEPRPGKGDGAFCLRIRAGESRILANFRPSYSAMNTLAHELGHGYHNLVTAHLTPLQRDIPMTAAETASTFCETIVRNAALAGASPAERLEILEGSLDGAGQVVIDILSRFLFEQRLLDRRRERELSVSELCELMLDAQRETYADGLDGDLLHPYMWAVKPHYYFTTFYNFPYTFGLLFGLGLYARYEADPERFRARYDDLLGSTGLEDVPSLAARMDIDVRAPEFWRDSLAVIRAEVPRFEELVAGNGTL